MGMERKTRDQIREEIRECGVVPAIRAASMELAVAAAGAVVEGGITTVEISAVFPCAVETVAYLRRTMGAHLVVGAGNVLTASMAEACIDAGAEFITTPHMDEEIVAVGQKASVAIIGGALTPSEVFRAWKRGVDFVNVFPCGKVGGPGYIKSLLGAMPEIPLIPTGGVNLSTAAAFLDAGAAALGVGAELVLPMAVAKKNAAPIIHAASQFVSIVRQRRHAAR